MIQAVARRSGEYYELRVTGHAEFNPGNDIVCAGVSGIVYALLGWCNNFPEHAMMFHAETESGDVVVRFKGDELAGVAFDMAAIGLMQIEKSYPQNIAIETTQSRKLHDSMELSI